MQKLKFKNVIQKLSGNSKVNCGEDNWHYILPWYACVANTQAP